MSSPTGPPITAEQLAALPPEFRALLRSVIDYYEARLAEQANRIAEQANRIAEQASRIAEQASRIAELEIKLDEALTGRKTPQNSSLPPSTQHPHAKPAPKKSKSKRKQGGQPGHSKHERALVPADQCAAILDHRPRRFRGCGGKLAGADPEPLRHQVWELPEIKPLAPERGRTRGRASHAET